MRLPWEDEPSPSRGVEAGEQAGGAASPSESALGGVPGASEGGGGELEVR